MYDGVIHVCMYVVTNDKWSTSMRESPTHTHYLTHIYEQSIPAAFKKEVDIVY